MIALWNRLRGTGAGKRPIAGTRLIVLACLITCWAGLAEATAENVAVFDPTAPNETCARRDHLYELDRAVSAGAYGTHANPVDGEVGTDVPVWKTIIIGGQDSAIALRAALKAARCGIGDLADEVLHLPDFAVRSSRTEVSLVVLSPADLGFGAEGATRAEIYRRAAELGFGLCPAEVGPQLRLQYLDQPLGEFLRIAMEPMTTDDEALVSLSIGNGGAGLLLIGNELRLNAIVPPSARFVFVRPDLPVTLLGEGSGSVGHIR